MLQADLIFRSILRLCRCDCLPLHIARIVGAAVFERTHVIDDIPRTMPRCPPSCRAGMPAAELALGFRAPLDMAAGVASAG